MNQFSQSLWGDEAFAAVLAQKPLGEIVTIVSHDTSPPLYYLFLHFWVKILGPSEVSIRTLSFIFFLLTVLVIYFFGKALGGRKTGILAAGFTFLNPFLFIYAFEGRMYSLLALTTTASMYFFFTKKRVGHLLSTTAALYTHHFALFALLVQVLWSIKEIFKNRRHFWTNLWPFFVIGLAYLPWLPALSFQTKLVASGFWLGKPTLKDLLNLVRDFFGGREESLLKNALFLLLVILLVFRQWQKNLKTDFFLFGWFLLPLFLTFLISLFASASIFFDRYLLYTIPALILLLVLSPRLLSYPLLTLTAFFLLWVNLAYFTHPTKRPFLKLAAYVKEAKREKDFLINWPGAAHHLFETKYYGLLAPIYSPSGPLPFYTGTALMEPGDIINKLPEIKGRLGVIGSGESPEASLANFNLLEKKTFASLYFLWLTEKD